MTTVTDGCATSTHREGALALAGQLAIAEARRLFELDVFDPPIGSTHPRAAQCLEIINGIMDRNGWRPDDGYKGNGPPQWCGMFAGDCWRVAGLDPKWLAVFFASTDRLVAWSTYQPFNGHTNPMPAGTDLRLCGALTPIRSPTFEPRAGDIVIVGDGTRKAGSHVTLCVSYDPARRSFRTISGNGGGVGPNGIKRGAGGGISAAEYFIDTGHYKAMFVIRPALGDLRVIA